MKRLALPFTLAMLACGCARSTPERLLGTLERDRVAVAAEASEPILRIEVSEGDDVEAGAPILSLDARRVDAQLAAAQAERQRASAALDAARRGVRTETIAAARATVAGNEASVANAKRERDRIAEVRARGLVAQAELDRADTSLRTSRAQADAARAQLAELLNGTRIEDIEQAEAALAAATAAASHLELTRARYDVRAPRAGRVDALPFKAGDQPPLGAVLLSLLDGPAYARVYIPASRRLQVGIGTPCRVQVEGIVEAFGARVRSVRADPAFTPYYALTGDDASRLAYRAELVLDGDTKALPAGLPAQADCDATTP